MSDDQAEQDRIRTCIEELRCPWCDRHSLIVVASHTSRAHGIGRHELRDRAGLRYSDSILPPEVARAWAERSREFLPPGSVTKGKKRRPRQISRRDRASIAKRMETLKRYAEDHPGQRAEAGRAAARAREARGIDGATWRAGIDEEHRAQRSRESQQARLKIPTSEWAGISARVAAGETRAALAAEYGVGPALIGRIVSGKRVAT